MTPADRQRWGSIGGLESWARTADRSKRTSMARRAFDARFEREVDPDGVLDPAELAKRVEAARRAHFGRMAMASAQARRKSAAARRGPS